MLDDLKQRLLKLDAVHGLYWIPAGLFMLWCAFYALQHVIQIAAVTAGVFLLIEGFKKLASNPVKAAAKLYVQRAAYLVEKEIAPETDTSLPATKPYNVTDGDSHE